MPSPTVTVWLMRSFEEDDGTSDAHLDIKKTRNTYTAQYTDKALKCNDTLAFSTYDDLMKYLDIFTRNILADRDGSKPFHSLQYMVPGFPATVIRREDLNDAETYNLFCETVDFFLRHSSD